MPRRRDRAGRVLVVAGVLAWLAMGAGPARAELYQFIRVNLFLPEIVKVEGKPVPVERLTEAVAALVEGDRRVRVEIIVPAGTDRATVKRLLDACRKAGATSLKVVQKA